MLGVHDNYCIFSIHHSCIHVLFSSLAAYQILPLYQVYKLCTNSLHHISQPMKLLHSYVYMYRYLHTTWHIESTHTTGTLSFSHFINILLSFYKTIFYSFLLHLYMHLHLHNTWHNNIIYMFMYRYTTDTLAFSLYINSTHFHTIFYSI